MSERQQLVSSIASNRQMKLALETVEALSKLKSEPDWIRQSRQRAWEFFEKLEIPKLDEEWVRIDLSNFSFEAITPTLNYPFSLDGLSEIPELKEWKEGVDQSKSESKSEKAEEAGILAQVGSAASEIYLNADLAKRGVIFTDLDTAIQKHPELVQRYFMSDGVKVGESKFTALHGALWSGGAFLYVPKGIEVELPLHSYFWMNGVQGDGILPHTLIVLEENSRLVYIDEYSSSAPNAQPGQGYALSNAVVEIFLKRGAQLSYFNVQRWGNNVYHFLKQRIISEADSQFTSASVALGSKFTKSNIEAILNGSGASAQMLGILMGDLDQFFAHNTLQKHIAPSTNSDLLFKAALKDKSHSFFSGLIRVEKGAQKAGAYQLNTNLLLSDGAKATPIPRLEIETNEVVKCTHGATVGPVDDEQIFYLMTRGLDYKTAERMIVLGFFDQVLQRIPIKSAKQKLISHIERKLEGI